jgi:flagellar brake protein
MSTSLDQQRYHTSAGDIFSVLRTLQSDRSSINVQFEGATAMHTTLVLAADLPSRTFQLDEFTPRSAHDKAAAGTPFSFRASVNGIRVHAKDLVVKQVKKDRDGVYYIVAFPERLLYLQRRDAFRVWVPGTLMVTAVCKSDKRPNALKGRVQNMSATGFRLLLEGKIEPQMEMLEKFEVEMHLPLIEQHLVCKAESMFSQYLQDRNQTICGFRFGAMGRGDLIAVNRFVTQLQRESIA